MKRSLTELVLRTLIQTRLPTLPPRQHHALARWALGAILAGKCQWPFSHCGPRHGGRRWPGDSPGHLGALAGDTRPANHRLTRGGCHAGGQPPRLRRRCAVLGARPLGAGPLVLGMDVALCRDDVALLCTSVRYRGTALPIAWGIVPATTPGAREPHWERMLRGIARVIPPTQQVRVRADQGLGSPQLWHAIHSHGFHPIMRVHVDASFAPPGQPRHPMRSFVPVSGLGWMGTGAAFKHAPKRMAGTLAVVWVEPWALLTDLPPDQMDAAWYALRMWDAAGFRQS